MTPMTGSDAMHNHMARDRRRRMALRAVLKPRAVASHPQRSRRSSQPTSRVPSPPSSASRHERCLHWRTAPRRHAPGTAQPYAGQQTAQSRHFAEDIAASAGAAGASPSRPSSTAIPGPLHVLELADKLELTPQQKTRVELIFKRMQLRAKSLGARYIAAEQSSIEVVPARARVECRQHCRRACATPSALRSELRRAHLAGAPRDDTGADRDAAQEICGAARLWRRRRAPARALGRIPLPTYGERVRVRRHRRRCASAAAHSTPLPIANDDGRGKNEAT